MLNITYWVLGVDWPLALNAKIGGHVSDGGSVEFHNRSSVRIG